MDHTNEGEEEREYRDEAAPRPWHSPDCALDDDQHSASAALFSQPATRLPSSNSVSDGMHMPEARSTWQTPMCISQSACQDARNYLTQQDLAQSVGPTLTSAAWGKSVHFSNPASAEMQRTEPHTTPNSSNSCSPTSDMEHTSSYTTDEFNSAYETSDESSASLPCLRQDTSSLINENGSTCSDFCPDEFSEHPQTWVSTRRGSDFDGICDLSKLNSRKRRRAGTSYAQPSTSYAEPSTSYARATSRHVETTADYMDSSTNFHQPSYADAAPAFGHSSLTSDMHSLSFAQPSPNYTQTSTSYNAQPFIAHDGPQAGYVEPSISYSQPSTSSGRRSTGYWQPARSYEHSSKCYIKPDSSDDESDASYDGSPSRQRRRLMTPIGKGKGKGEGKGKGKGKRNAH